MVPKLGCIVDVSGVIIKLKRNFNNWNQWVEQKGVPSETHPEGGLPAGLSLMV